MTHCVCAKLVKTQSQHFDKLISKFFHINNLKLITTTQPSVPGEPKEWSWTWLETKHTEPLDMAMGGRSNASWVCVQWHVDHQSIPGSPSSYSAVFSVFLLCTISLNLILGMILEVGVFNILQSLQRRLGSLLPFPACSHISCFFW